MIGRRATPIQRWRRRRMMRGVAVTGGMILLLFAAAWAILPGGAP